VKTFNEENISAKQTSSQKPSRVPCTHEDSGRPQDNQQAPSHRKKASCSDSQQLKTFFAFPKAARLRRRWEYLALKSSGQELRGEKLGITLLKSPASRLGITVSKKYGSSPERAHFKRCVREVFRHLRPEFASPLTLNVRPLRGAPLTFDEIAADMRALLPLHPPTLIIRHRRENKKKCSLSPLTQCPGFKFHPYPGDRPKLTPETILLAPDAPVLSPEDGPAPLLLLDSTWALLSKMTRWIDPEGTLRRRSLPAYWQTAYPRCQEVREGLASIEALFAAYTILGYEKDHLLAYYHWRASFLALNEKLC